MIYAKYEFTEVPDLSEIDGSVIELGKLVVTQGTYDEEGNVITEPVYSDKFAVDILYNNEVDETLEGSRIYPVTPSHFIAGCEKLYLDTLPE